MPVKSLHHLCCMLSLVVATEINAQNLVVNPDFEEVETKPFFWPKISITKGWSNGNGGTADFFNRRACSYENGVPNNYMGTQDPYNGDRYAGIIAFYEDGTHKPVRTAGAVTKVALPGSTIAGDSIPALQPEIINGKYAEYLQCALSTTLTAGSTYVVSFRVSLADKSAWAVAGLGACLAAQPSAVKTNSYSMLVPQIAATSFVEDKNSWTEITGTHVAKGDEKYLLIGAFRPVLKAKKIIPEYTDNNKKAYYYIDGVSVVLTVIKPEIKEEVKPAIDFSAALNGGKSFVFKELRFETAKPTIVPESKGELDLLADWLKNNNSLKVVIGCHTDKTGADMVNQKLSDERAMAIKKHLISKGIDGERIKAKGYGSTKLLDKTNPAAKENRRVEISILK